MKSPDKLKIIAYKSATEWETWLEKNHRTSPGLWIRIFKKGSGKPSITYAQALDGALCYGWIDGQKQKYDDDSWLQRFTPRRPKSSWSKINTGHIERLIKTGKMKEAGLTHVNAAKQDGRWAKAYDSQSMATLPEDFLQELAKNKKAKIFFATLSKSNLYDIFYRLQTAKKEETKQKRLKAIIAMLEKGEKFYP